MNYGGSHQWPGPYFIKWHGNKDVIPFPAWHPFCGWSQSYDISVTWIAVLWPTCTAKRPKVWPPLINSHFFMQTLTNQKSRTVSSCVLIGLSLYERMWINQKRPHFWVPCCNAQAIETNYWWSVLRKELPKFKSCRKFIFSAKLTGLGVSRSTFLLAQR